MEEIRYDGACSVCGRKLSKKETVIASVLDVCGWLQVKHDIMRCRNFECSLNCAAVAYNFVCSGSEYVFSWGQEECMQYFFLTYAFGVSIRWLRQFSRRLIFQWSSFAGEAKVHFLEAVGLGKSDIVPDKAKLKLLRAWMLWRLVTWQVWYIICDMLYSRKYLRSIISDIYIYIES